MDGETTISVEELKRVGISKGLKNIGFVEKDYFQDLILLFISRNNNRIVFKGGTSLFKLYDLARFSDDLDFTGNVDENFIYNAKRFLSNFGYESYTKTLDSRAGTSFNIFIKGPLFNGKPESQCRIAIDISNRNDLYLGFQTRLYESKYNVFPEFNIFSMDINEILAEKTRALIIRKKPRDLFDVFFLLRRGINIDYDLISKKLSYYNKNFDKEDVMKSIEIIRPVWKKELKPFVLTELPDIDTVEDYLKDKFK